MLRLAHAPRTPQGGVAFGPALSPPPARHAHAPRHPASPHLQTAITARTLGRCPSRAHTLLSNGMAYKEHTTHRNMYMPCHAWRRARFRNRATALPACSHLVPSCFLWACPVWAYSSSSNLHAARQCQRPRPCAFSHFLRGGVSGRLAPKLNFCLSAGLRMRKEHMRLSSTAMTAPALSNSPQ